MHGRHQIVISQTYAGTSIPATNVSTEKVILRPIISIPAPLFVKVHVDTMHMAVSGGYHFILQARCSLSGWPEWRMLKKKKGRRVGKSLFEE
jgi:hypothetical protein